MDYTVALVTYLDVLGFKEILENRTAYEIRKLLDLFRTETDPGGSDDENAGVSFFNFSDLIVRVTNVLSPNNRKFPYGVVFHEVLDLAHVQARLAYHGVLVRGGVAIGEIVAGEEMIFGPALVRAYALESQMAIYPRIVVDPDVLLALGVSPLLRKDTHDRKTERKRVLELLRRGDDGVHFVDYLRVVATEDPDNARRLLSVHRDLIEATAKGRKNLDSTTVKMSWLGSYHNDTVHTLGMAAALKVPARALKMVYGSMGRK